MKNVLLIQPPIHPESMIFGIMDPYGLEILAAGLREDNNDVNVRIIDLRVEKRSRGLKIIKEFKPDIVGITGISIDYPEMINLLHYVKENCSKYILTVIGGHHATMIPSDFYMPSCDVIVQGPGIEALKEICSTQNTQDLKKIKGIIYRDEGNNFCRTPPRNDFDEIKRWPLPAYDLTKNYMNKYLAFGHKYNVVTTAMGCPFRCKFCACWKALSGNYVIGVPESIVSQIANTPNKYIFFGDDFTFGNFNQAKAIAKLIKDAGIKKYYLGYCRADVIIKNFEVIKMWKEIGLKSLTVGMESVNEEDLKFYNKKTTLEMNNRANVLLLDLGVHNLAHFIVKPSFKQKDFKLLSDYNLELGTAHPVFPILTPLPGTDLAEEFSDRVITREYQYYDLAHPVMDIQGRDIRSFYDNLKMLYFKNYSYKRWIISKFRKFINFINRKQVYTKAQVNAPEFISIPYNRIWSKIQLKKNKAFISKILKKQN